MVTDPIADLIIRLKNASDVHKPTVVVTQTKLTESIAFALKKAGYVASVDKNKDTRELKLSLVYFAGEPRIHGVERISTSSRRMYQGYNDIRTFRSGFGNTFLSTPKGVLMDMEAKKNKVGGEVLFKIW